MSKLFDILDFAYKNTEHGVFNNNSHTLHGIRISHERCLGMHLYMLYHGDKLIADLTYDDVYSIKDDHFEYPVDMSDPCVGSQWNIDFRIPFLEKNKNFVHYDLDGIDHDSCVEFAIDYGSGESSLFQQSLVHNFDSTDIGYVLAVADIFSELELTKKNNVALMSVRGDKFKKFCSILDIEPKDLS